MQTTGGEAPKDPAEEEAARCKAYVEALTRATEEEKARRNAYAEAVTRAAQENKARRKAYQEAIKRAAEEEAARRGVDAATLTTMLPAGKKKKGRL
jgi:thymidylate synthase ThyX